METNPNRLSQESQLHDSKEEYEKLGIALSDVTACNLMSVADLRRMTRTNRETFHFHHYLHEKLHDKFIHV